MLLNIIPDVLIDDKRHPVVKESTVVNLNEKKDIEHPLEDDEFQEENDPQYKNMDSPKEGKEEEEENNSPTKMIRDIMNTNEVEDEDEQLVHYTDEQLSKVNEKLLHMDISTLSEFGTKKIDMTIIDEYKKKVCIKKKTNKCVFHCFFINFVNYSRISIMKRQLK